MVCGHHYGIVNPMCQNNSTVPNRRPKATRCPTSGGMAAATSTSTEDLASWTSLPASPCGAKELQRHVRACFIQMTGLLGVATEAYLVFSSLYIPRAAALYELIAIQNKPCISFLTKAPVKVPAILVYLCNLEDQLPPSARACLPLLRCMLRLLDNLAVVNVMVSAKAPIRASNEKISKPARM